MEEINNKTAYVFQVDSDIVQQVYTKQDNFIIEYNNQGDKNWCAIYFCSNGIYYPNTEETFRKQIIEKNFFEWYHSRINRASKHIFIRDVFKQWYLTGINIKINTPQKLTEFLRKETEGYNIITIGSSAGGYAAILHGSLLSAKYVLAFNPQFEIKSLLDTSSETKNPIVFRKQKKENEYYDIIPYINKDTDIFYFYSKASKVDIKQYSYIKDRKNNIYILSFNSSYHGIPFLKVALHDVLNMGIENLKILSEKEHSPLLFAIKTVGIYRIIYKTLKKAYKKKGLTIGLKTLVEKLERLC